MNHVRLIAAVALGAALAAVAISAILRPYLGTVVSYALAPLLLAAVAFMITTGIRLRRVGRFSSEGEYLQANLHRPWVRWWLLTRFGLFGSMLLLIIAIVVTAILHGPFAYCVEALVYLVLIRIFVDCLLGAVANVDLVRQGSSN